MAWDFDLAKWYNNKLKSQCRRDKQLQYNWVRFTNVIPITGLYMFTVGTVGIPSHWGAAHFSVFFLPCLFIFSVYILYLAELHLHLPHAVLAGSGIMLSTDCFQERLFTQPVNPLNLCRYLPTRTATFQSPWCWDDSGFLYNSCGYSVLFIAS